MHMYTFCFFNLCECFAREVVVVEEVGQNFLVERVGAAEVLADSSLGEGVPWRPTQAQESKEKQKEKKEKGEKKWITSK